MCSPLPGVCRRADAKARAKRYERLMKANGINPNGGPDPKPTPVSMPKESKNKNRDDTPKPPAKRRKINKTGETKQREKQEEAGEEKKKEDLSVAPQSIPERLKDISTEEKDCRSVGDSHPLAVIQETHFEATEMGGTSFDFDEFCSPEMFAHCDPQTRRLSQTEGDQLVSSGCLQHALFSHPPQMVSHAKEEMKTEKEAERETVVIPD